MTVLIPPGPNAGALSDAVSKPLFISGASHWQAAAKQLGLEYAMLIDASGRIQLTPGMQQRIKLEKPDAAEH